MRPSCGTRRSEMSRFAMILRREMIAGSRRFGGASVSWSTPSMRNRMRNTFSYGSQCRSEAPLRIASTSTMLTSFTLFASLDHLDVADFRGDLAEHVGHRRRGRLVVLLDALANRGLRRHDGENLKIRHER